MPPMIRLSDEMLHRRGGTVGGLLATRTPLDPGPPARGEIIENGPGGGAGPAKFSIIPAGPEARGPGGSGRAGGTPGVA